MIYCMSATAVLIYVNVNAHVVNVPSAILAEHLESATERIYDL